MCAKNGYEIGNTKHDFDGVDCTIECGGFPIDDGECQWYSPRIDVQLKSSFDIDSNSFSSVELRDNGVDEGSLVYMLGYPMGLVNVNSELPICRMGCIARISEEQIAESHDALLDIQNFPGNSGSPIVSKPEFIGIQGTNILDSCVLIGLIHAYLPYRESLINSQTKEIVEVRSENSGLALMHPVEYIRDVIDMFYTKPAVAE